MTEGIEYVHTDYSYRDNIPKTEFTKTHLEIFENLTARWKRNAYSTQRIDKPFARAAIKALYRLEGRPAPYIVWTKSPLANIFAKVLCDEILGLTAPDRVYNNYRTSEQTLWDHIGPSVIASVDSVTTDFCVVNRDALGDIIQDGTLWSDFGWRDDRAVDGIKSAIKTSLNLAVSYIEDFVDRSPGASLEGDKLWTDLCDAIKTGLGKSVAKISDKTYPEETRRQLSAFLLALRRGDGNWGVPKKGKDATKNYVRRKIQSATGDHAYSQYNLAKLSEYKCLADTDLIPRSEKLEYLYHLCESVGWVLPSRKACFVSERPEILKVDDRGLLHCEDGPAIVYPDGLSHYALHGVSIPRRWTEFKPSPSEALLWPNIEQRRVACELVGWENIIDELDAVVLDKDSNPEIGELLTINLPGIGVEKFLRVTCGTGRKFAMPVPPEMATALQANAWTWGLEPDQYKPEVRT